MGAARTRYGERHGSALVQVVFGAFALTAVVSVMTTRSLSSSRTAALERFEQRARYLAEGAMDVAAREVTDALAGARSHPTSGIVRIDGSDVHYEVRATGSESRTTTTSGLRTLRTGYEIAAWASVSDVEHTEVQQIDSVAVPIFQFGAFHSDDLELNPAGSLELEGRIHAGGDLYLNCGGTLTLDTNHVTAAGHLYRDRKAGLEPRSGTVRIRRWVARPRDVGEPVEFVESPSQLALAALGVPTTSGFDSNFARGWDAAGDGDFADEGDWLPWGRGALEAWSQPTGYGQKGHTVRTRSHGVHRASAPDVASIALDGPFHRQAGLVVIAQPDLSYRILDAQGVDVSAAFPDVVQAGELFDARQAGTTMAKVLVVRIDLGRLAELGGSPANGLIYAAWSGSGNGTRMRGVVLEGGAALAGPLTVASENSIYVAGDYNVVDPVPAALICDAVNLLSNAWDGSKERGELPRARATTYNVALLTGDTSTVGTSYGGGLENLARLHEDWEGVRLSLRGSLVRGWESRHATGRWESGGDRFTPPLREFTYETGFDRSVGLPPFTPSAVTAVAALGS